MSAIRDLREKTAKELLDLLKTLREKMRDLRWRASQKQLKNPRELRQVKKEIARVSTILNNQKN